ncbi:DUF2779 domain-containing protein [bacterium]|nr:MAG: DUF2779 domain-containing protein [bacterium]
MITTPFLSKSKYLNGLQCPKLLWHYYNAKEEIPKTDAETQAIFDQGHEVGELAKKLYPDGIEVAKGLVDFEKVIEQTQKLISKRKPLFEAAFLYKSAYARVDILNPVEDDGWEIIEVKSSTRVKDINLRDLSLQWYTYQGAGLSIKRSYILHINNQYVRKGEIDPEKLFTLTDITEEVKDLLPLVERQLADMTETISGKTCPEVAIGTHCSTPYDCPLQQKCFVFLPEHNLLTLYYINKEKAFALIHQGVTDILALNDRVELSDKQKLQVESLRSKKPYLNKSGIRTFLDTLEYPLYFLDFETIGPAMPLFDNTIPHQPIPFQFSLHIQRSAGKDTEHYSYLADGKHDPRPELLKLLKKHLGHQGSIITYSASFEKDKLNRACEAFPEFAKWNDGIQKRIVDLLDPFKAFHFYHYDQKGSASIKSVLPVLTGTGYEGMAISEGGMASREFLRVTFGENITEEERMAVRKNLEDYCSLDTMAMVEIVEKLREMV